MCIFYTNADQLINKKSELEMQIAGREPDIILITEVIPKAQISPIHPALLKLPGYTCFTSFDPAQANLGASGIRGICIYTRETIKAQETVFSSNNAKENLWVTIQLRGADVLLAGCIYRSPGSNRDNNEALCKLLNAAADTKPSHLLVCGDFNFGDINWDCGISTAPSTHPSHQFIETVQDNFLHQHIQEPTRYREGNQPRTLDLVLTNEERMVTNLQLQPGLGKSDHVIITFCLTCYADPAHSETPKLAINRADFEKMAELFRQLSWEPLREKDAENSLSYFSGHMHNISRECIPAQRPKRKRKSLYLTREAIRLKNLKQRLWKKHVSTYPGKIKAVDEYNYKKARNNLRKLTRRLQSHYEKDIAKRSKKAPKVFWSYANSKLKTKPRLDDLQRSDGSLADSDKEKANILSDFFTSVFTREDLTHIPDISPPYNGVPLESVQAPPVIVANKLKQLRPDSSPGPDEIHPKVLKELAESLSVPLSIIFQKSLDEACVPTPWKEAEVVPIFKKGKRQDPTNYRPISLTSVVSKMLESIVRDRVLEFMVETNQLSQTQHGFIQKRSCITQLLSTMEEWTRIIESKQPMDVLYLDYKKAFDSVPHERLLVKLHAYGIRGKLLQWIRSFLTGRRQCVRVGSARSEWQPVISGIPQGSVLGPTLFILYINDLPSVVKKSVKLFADDTKLYSNVCDDTDHSALGADLLSLEEWSRKWQLPFNTSKCSVLHLGPHNQGRKYTMAGDTLTTTAEEKDLGIIIDKELKFHAQAASASRKANQILGVVRRAFANLDSETLPLLYKSLVRPLLEYGNTIWGPFYRGDQIMLEQVQRRATRLIPGIRHMTYEERLRYLKLPSLEYRRKRGDMIWMYNLITGRTGLNKDEFLQMAPGSTTRGHALKVFKPVALSRERRNHLCIRSVTDWNSLPSWVVDSENTNIFKNNLDKCWERHMYHTPY